MNESASFDPNISHYRVLGRLGAGGMGEVYRALDGALMAVNVREGAAGLDVGLPVTLVPARDLHAEVEGPDFSDYAVTADGQRFLFKVPAANTEPSRIHVLLDWPSLVK